MMTLIHDQLLYFNWKFSLPNISYLIQHLPVFCVHSSQIEILPGPKEFYKELLNQSSKAVKRITIASLYLGNGELEKNLVSRMSERLSCKSNLRISWLLDYTRASRGESNSRTMLLPLLLNGNNANCSVSLFHTPNLRGCLKLVLPNKYNEVIGLHHMKVYVFDDSVIISGANLSNDYFENRQDRYFIIKNCTELADFYETLIQEVSRRSFRLRPDNKTELHSDTEIHPYKGNKAAYCNEFKNSISEFWTSEIGKNASKLENLYKQHQNNDNNTNVPNTLIFPTIQMPQFKITHDSEATVNFFESLGPNSRIHLATGYFNLTKQYGNTILGKNKSEFNILCAHPTANGFLGAGGFRGGIPAAYTNFLKHFYNKIAAKFLLQQIRLSEFQKEGWTFHAKGLWYFPPTEVLPTTTVVGSPNFGYRSVYKDLESQLFVSTTCPSLRKSFFDEERNLYTSSTLVTKDTFHLEERKVPLWVRFFTYFMKFFF